MTARYDPAWVEWRWKPAAKPGCLDMGTHTIAVGRKAS